MSKVLEKFFLSNCFQISLTLIFVLTFLCIRLNSPPTKMWEFQIFIPFVCFFLPKKLSSNLHFLLLFKIRSSYRKKTMSWFKDRDFTFCRLRFTISSITTTTTSSSSLASISYLNTFFRCSWPGCSLLFVLYLFLRHLFHTRLFIEQNGLSSAFVLLINARIWLYSHFVHILLFVFLFVFYIIVQILWVHFTVSQEIHFCIYLAQISFCFFAAAGLIWSGTRASGMLCELGSDMKPVIKWCLNTFPCPPEEREREKIEIRTSQPFDKWVFDKHESRTSKKQGSL